MTSVERVCERFVPLGAALMLALPLLAIGASSRADERQALPGVLEGERVVVPAGELAGHGLRVSQVGSRLAPADALASVEREWRRHSGAAVLRADSEGWAVLSRRLDEGFETLQLRARAHGGSEGLFTRWSDRAAPLRARRALGELLPVDARITRQLASHDAAANGARRADTLLAQLPHGIDEAERRVDAQLRRAGFARLPMPPARHQSAWRNDRARFYRGAGAEVMVTLHARESDTALVLYHVEVAP